MKITITHQGTVETLRDALDIYLEAMEQVKIFGINATAEWNYDQSHYVAECFIGEGRDVAVVRASVPVIDENAKSHGLQYEQKCDDIGHRLGEWLQDVFGSEWDYGIETE